MGTVMRLLSKKRIDKGCYQHDYRYDAARYFHAMGCKAQQEGIRKAGTTPEAEHNDIQYQLTEMVYVPVNSAVVGVFEVSSPARKYT